MIVRGDKLHHSDSLALVEGIIRFFVLVKIVAFRHNTKWIEGRLRGPWPFASSARATNETEPRGQYHMMPDPFILTARAPDWEQCLAALTLAFSCDPPCRWAWPDPQQYLEAFPRFARAFGGSAIGNGTAHYYEGFCGVALWLSPGTAPDEASLVKVIEDTIADERKGAMFSIFEQMDALHLREAHWYLPLIGVDPAHQRRGPMSSPNAIPISASCGRKLFRVSAAQA